MLDVLQDECVLQRVAIAGDALRTQCRAALSRYDCVGDVRGVGLANGIELVTDGISKFPDATLAGMVKMGLRRRNVLVGCTGPRDNVIKIRPPLAFTEAEVPLFVNAFVAALEEALAERCEAK